MKKYLLHGFLTLLFTSMIVGCGGGDDDDGGGEEADTTSPVNTLLGSTPVSVDKGTTYSDAGATASDNKDGNLTSSIVTVNPVNTGVAGSYTVTYNVSDAASNAANEVTRTVNVIENTAFQRGVEGVIRNYATGVGIAGMDVTVGNETVATDASGSYQVPVAGGANPRVIVTVSGTGFSTTSQIVSIGAAANARTSLDVDLLPVAFSGSFNPTQNFTAQVPSSPANVVNRCRFTS